MKKTKKLVRVIPPLCMAFTMSSAIAFADDVATSGTEANPIFMEDSDVNTPEITAKAVIPADTAVYYQGMLSGMTMNITGNVSVVYNGETYTAKNGVVTVEFPEAVGRPMPCVFQIVNSTNGDVTADIECTYPLGTLMNPEAITTGKYATEIKEGTNGYYYTIEAPMSGKLTVSVASNKGWFYCVNNVTANVYGDMHYSDDETVVSSETIEVAKGDKVQITVNAVDVDAWYATVEGTVDVEVAFAPESGMYKANDGVWYYYTNGEIDTNFTGMAKNQYGWFYMTNGKFDAKYTGMAKNQYGWFYMTNGKLDTKFTGMAKNQYGWFYMTNGKLDTKFTGMAKNKYGWFYMTNGKLDTKFTGMAKNQYGWFYMTNGKYDTKYTGMAKNQYGWFYMTKGKLDTKFTGMAKNQYGWFYMTNGKLNTKFTGLAKNQWGWWYMTNGKLNTKFTGLADNAYGKWYVENGKVNTKYTGKVVIDGKTYEVKNGKVQAINVSPDLNPSPEL